MSMRPMRYFFAIFLIAGLTCTRSTRDFGSRTPGSYLPSKSLALENLDRYASCDEVKHDLRTNLLSQMQVNWRSAQYAKAHPYNYDTEAAATNDAAPVANGSSTANSQASTSEVSTNIQVEGVDEPDTIKMSSNAIFIADNQPTPGDLSIAIVAKNPLAAAGTIGIKGLIAPQIYTLADQLIVTGMQQTPYNGDGNDWGSRFTVKVYNVKGPPVLQTEYFLPSQPLDSRLIGSKLFVVLREQLRQKGSIPYPSDEDLKGTFEQFSANFKVEEIFEISDDAIAGVPCASMLKMPPFGGRFQFQRVISYDVVKGEIMDEVAIPGHDVGIYMTNRNLYTFGQPILPNSWVNPNDEAGQKAISEMSALARETLVIKKVSLDPKTGKLMPEALGSIEGHLKSFDSLWAFNEITKNDETFLSVVTTTGDIRDQTGANSASNHLIILRQQENQLVEASSVKDFGQNEDVRSVRYIGDRAYVVTFKRTDPLFTIDLSNPLAPKIVGELKIPGFSLYLHPHADNRLLGAGYQTEESGETDINRAFFQGVLFQLFDIADPTAPTRLDFVELGKRGSYSEANQDHHAFYYDVKNALAGIPVVLFDDGNGSQPLNGQRNHSTRTFSGAILYRIQSSKLEEVKRISHFDLLGPNCQSNLQPLTWTSPIVANPEVRRIFRDGNTIFAVSNFGVKTIDATTFADLGTVSLNRPDCRAQVAAGGFE